MNPASPVLTLKEAAELVQCTPETLAARAHDGDLPGLKIGQGWIFPTQAFVARLNELAVEEAAARRQRPAPLGVSTLGVDARGLPVLPDLTGPRKRQPSRRRPPPLPKLP